MPFMFVHSSCVACPAIISYHADYVPSLVVRGQREPVCASCFSQWNQIHRISKGLEPVKIHPQAYEPMEIA